VTAITRARRNRIIAGVLGIGLLVGIMEIVAYETWTDWQAEIFSPLSFQVMFLYFGGASLLNSMGTWDSAILLCSIGVVLFLATSLLALTPLLVAEINRILCARIVLVLLVLSAAVGWWEIWGLLEYGPNNSWRRPLAYASGGLLALCLIAHWFWQRNPDGRAAFWYPAILQVWIQSLWIPFPDDD
jgi:hypothetical protein